MSLTEPTVPQDESFPRPWRNSLLGAAVLGLVLIVVVAYTGIGASALGLLLTMAAGSLATGIAVGFLFGVPKADSEKSTSPYLPNTSIEQISDWLTKLIIGATLVQLGAIGSALGSFFRDAAGSMGTNVNAVIPGAIAIYFAVLGFLGSWLLTRLRLASAFSSVDRHVARQVMLEDRRLASLQQDARNRGDVAEAERLEAERQRLRASLEVLAGDLTAIRQLEPPGGTRTQQLEETYHQLRSTVAGRLWTPQEVDNLYLANADGRLSALATMHEHLDLASAPLLATSIQASRSAFEQYKALQVVDAALDTFDAQAIEQLRQAIIDQMGPDGYITEGSDRRTVAVHILERIDG